MSETSNAILNMYRDYVEYVEAKIDIDEIPLTLKEWNDLNKIANKLNKIAAANKNQKHRTQK